MPIYMVFFYDSILTKSVDENIFKVYYNVIEYHHIQRGEESWEKNTDS